MPAHPNEPWMQHFRNICSLHVAQHARECDKPSNVPALALARQWKMSLSVSLAAGSRCCPVPEVLKPTGTQLPFPAPCCCSTQNSLLLGYLHGEKTIKPQITKNRARKHRKNQQALSLLNWRAWKNEVLLTMVQQRCFSIRLFFF